jgi:zinc/manganese transport system ATP-binding protein/zinc transport system ATP-binding protein
MDERFFSPPLVEFRDVAFGYGADTVLEDVSLRIEAGQWAALVGPSGAGKTTLLKLVLGLLRPARGAILVGGQPLGGGRRLRVGYVPQLETVDWSFPVTVSETVLMGRAGRSSVWPWPSREDRRRVADVLERLKIGALAGRHIRALSDGQRQRVFLARALVSEPDLLVLDEPTTGVDARTAEGVLELLGELNRAGLTVLMTTHDLNAAAAHAPWAICLNRRLIAEGPPEEVFTPDILGATYGGEMTVLRHDGVLLVHQRPRARGVVMSTER